MTGQGDAILDAALALGEEQDWERVRLYRVAERLDISLTAVRQHVRQKEDLVDAWFDRADAAMLDAADSGLLCDPSTADRLEHLIFVWLEALSPHRRLTAQMIQQKMEPGHLHVQIPAILRISRTVQWLREAAHRDTRGIHRGLEETVLTTVFVSTFLYWLRDASHGHERTRARLRQALGMASRLSRLVPGYSGQQARPRGALPRPSTVQVQ